MRTKEYRKYISAIAIYSILICNTTIALGDDLQDPKQEPAKPSIVEAEMLIENDDHISPVHTKETTDNSSSDDTADSEDKEPSMIPDIIDYNCTDDVLFRFDSGAGSQSLKIITEVIISPYEGDSSECTDDKKIIFSYGDDDFSYSLTKGELIIKNDAIKESNMIPGKSYCIAICGNLIDETPMHLEESKDWILNYTTPLSDEEKDISLPEPTEQISFSSKFIDPVGHPDVQHTVDLTRGNTLISSEEMLNLIELNQTKDIIINTTDGVVFTFLKGSMELVDGKNEYDFGVELITDSSQSGVEIPSENFVFRITYNNTGKLPGTAQVRIPLGNHWSGRQVCYSAVNDAGILYTTTETVDENGVYMIPELQFTL